MELRRSRRMLTGIAVISATAAGVLSILAFKAPPAGAAIVWPLVVVMITIVVVAGMLLRRNAIIRRINADGLYLKSHGPEPIPWKDIEAFSIDHTAEGGEVLCIHLRESKKYFSGLSVGKLLAATGRQILGYTPITVVPSTMNVSVEDIVREMKKHVPERSAA
jgi:hypothetical protein